MKRYPVFVVCSFLIASMMLSGCGSSGDNSDITPDIATSDKSAGDGIEEIVIDDSQESGMDDTTSTIEIAEIDLGSYGYQYKYYYDYMLNKYDGKNAVFSPEALHAAFGFYGFFVSESDKLTIYQNVLLDRDYFLYDLPDGCNLVNSIWKSSSDSIHIDDSVFYDDYMHVFDSADLSKICNDFISGASSGRVKQIDPFLSSSDTLKMFSYVNFDSNWVGGERARGYNERFTLYDGTTVDNVKTISSVSLDGNDYCSYYRSDNAMACKMRYANGYELVVILPDNDVSVKDLEIIDFMNNYGNVVKLDSDVYFQMPVFDVKGYFDVLATDLGLGDITISEKYGKSDNVISAAQYADFEIGYVDKDKQMTESDVTSLYSSRMICDRPFAFYVMDIANKDILYIGVVNEM